MLSIRTRPRGPRQREPEPSTINEKTVADFTRVVEQTGILVREAAARGKSRRLFKLLRESSSIWPLRVQNRRRGIGGQIRQARIVMATAGALILSVLLSWGAVYGLNRYLGPGDDPAETTGALHHRPPTD